MQRSNAEKEALSNHSNALKSHLDYMLRRHEEMSSPSIC